MTTPSSIDFPTIKKMGVSVDCGSFLIIRPTSSYRMHSSVVVLKGEHPVIIDAGTTVEPGIKQIEQSLIAHKIDPTSVKYIILTHSHSDHVLQLYGLQRLCSNAKVICHEKEVFNIQHPTRMEKSWHKALELLGKSNVNRLFYALLSVPGYVVFYRSINLYPRIDFMVRASLQHNGFDLLDHPSLNSGEHKIYFIPTPGHSVGHMCIYNRTHKIMYLGDFVPFTPWINPLPEALDDMIQSCKNFLTLSTKEVEYSVSAHGDIRRDNWEIMEWSCAKEKFLLFLDTIYESLDRIPKLVSHTPLSSENIAQLLIPQYKRYLWVMRVFFIPPALTWILAYCQKLENQGKIRRIVKGTKILWTAS